MENASKNVDVTAIIPYFRSADTIWRAVDSILNQTVLPREIIVVDDFSNTEEDKAALEKLEQYNDLITVYFLDKNVGPGEARNKGLDEAKGKYIAFLDSDDVWTEEKLDRQVDLMEKTNAFITCHYSAIKGEKERNSGEVTIISTTKQLLKNRLHTRSVMMKNTKDYRFEKGKRRVEDFLMWTQMIIDGKKAMYLDETLAHSFKEHYGASGMTANINKMYIDALRAFKSLKNEKRINVVTYIGLIIIQSLKQVFRHLKLFIKRKTS